MRRLLLVLSVAVLAACSGDAGPTGPAGAAGPAGPAGPQGLPGTPAQFAWDTVVLDGSGDGVITFTNAQIETSVWNCYISDTAAGPWLLLANDGVTFCGAFNIGTSLVVTMINGVAGWVFLATIAGL